MGTTTKSVMVRRMIAAGETPNRWNYQGTLHFPSGTEKKMRDEKK